MKLQVRALLGVVIISISFAQDHAFNTTSGSTDPLVAAQEAQQQAQFQFENQLADLQTSANQSKEPLISRRTQLNRELQKCFTDKNTAGIEAEREASKAEQQATQQMVQSVPQALTPLVQSFANKNSEGKEEAKSRRDAAVDQQNAAASRLATACAGFENGFGTIRFNATGSNAAAVLAAARNMNNSVTTTLPTNCQAAIPGFLATTSQSKTEVEQSKKADSAFSGNLLNAGMAAAALGINYYGYQNAKDSAKQGLADANRLNALNYDSCKVGVEDEAKEIDRQLANIDKQLAADKERLAKQFAQFKINLPPNIQNKPLLDVAGTDTSGDVPTLTSVGAGVSPTTFKGITNPFDGLKKPDGGGGVAGAGGGGGAAGGAGGADGDGKAGWGFRDPYETNNPGMSYTLPQQPDKAGLIAGAGEGTEGAGQGNGENNPFGPGFPGFEDPFANVNGKGTALAASEGNGFWELAMKTRRRVYAHLGELLGRPTGTKISKDKEKAPERKISSVRE